MTRRTSAPGWCRSGTALVAVVVLACNALWAQERQEAASEPVQQPTVTGEPAQKESFLPDGVFQQGRPTQGMRALESVPRRRMLPRGVSGNCHSGSEVFLYTSEPSQRQIMQWGMDPATGTRQWENALRDLRWRHCRVSSAEDLDRVERAGLLILPQTALLSRAERLAITRWRNRAGAVLSTWETGTFDENGRPTGPSFMDTVLGVRLHARQGDSSELRYALPFGSNPLLWQVPAAQRMLLEHIVRMPARQLVGQHTAAVLSDWSRHAGAGGAAGLVVFGERGLAGGGTSRSVALGYPEQAWQRMDPGLFAAMHSDLLHWLLRKPQAYLATWPWPYQNANVLAVFPRAPLGDASSAAALARLGQRASVFMPPGAAQEQDAGASAPQPPTVPSGWSAGWAGAPQGDWLHAVRKTPVTATQWRAWAEAPEGGVGHALVGLDADDSRQPFWLYRAGGEGVGAVGLPVTLAGLAGSGAAALASWLPQLESAQRAGGLSVVPLDGPLTMDGATLAKVLRQLGKSPGHWLTTGAEVERWWRVRSQVQALQWVALDDATWELRVRAASAVPLGVDLPVVVTMPSVRHVARAQPLQEGSKVAAVHRLDAWRSVLLLRGVPAGESRWRVQVAAP